MEKNCNCSSNGEFLVMACSGASDIGQMTDLVARRLRDENQRAMKCLAMVAADNLPLIDSLKLANVLVIDGCPVDCGKKIMEKAGLSNYNYIRLTDWGYQKGKTPVNETTVNEIFERAVLHC